ncbi:MAG: hypothetical protein OEM38_04965 [Gammaproteobacteria bacterium]|nr:hypothetical protein [Gammaproteobacteria bacterium]
MIKFSLVICLLLPAISWAGSINDIRQSTAKWNPEAVEKAHGKLVVILNDDTITKAIYKSIVIDGICSLTWSDKSTSMDDVDNILVINKNKDQGLVFEGGKAECIKLGGIKQETSEQLLFEKTRDF